MSRCTNCGAPIAPAKDGSTACGFCGCENLPLPTEVPVVVPVQVVHKVVQVVGGTSQNERELRCPHCGKRLVAVRAADAELNGCAGCGGIWIDNESARRVVASPQRVFGELATRAAQNAPGGAARIDRPTCPMCPAVLDRVSVHDIELDICADHGTWFDANELARLTAALRGEKAPEARPRRDGEVRCSGCKSVIRVDRANLTEDGLTCERCWRKPEAAYAAAVAKAAHDQTAGQVLVGAVAVLLGAAVISKST